MCNEFWFKFFYLQESLLYEKGIRRVTFLTSYKVIKSYQLSFYIIPKYCDYNIFENFLHTHIIEYLYELTYLVFIVPWTWDKIWYMNVEQYHTPVHIFCRNWLIKRIIEVCESSLYKWMNLDVHAGLTWSKRIGTVSFSGLCNRIWLEWCCIMLQSVLNPM